MFPITCTIRRFYIFFFYTSHPLPRGAFKTKPRSGVMRECMVRRGCQITSKISKGSMDHVTNSLLHASFKNLKASQLVACLLGFSSHNLCTQFFAAFFSSFYPFWHFFFFFFVL